MKKYLRRAYIDYVNKVIDVHLNEDDISYHYFMNRELRRVRIWVNTIIVVTMAVNAVREIAIVKDVRRGNPAHVVAIVSVVKKSAAALSRYNLHYQDSELYLRTIIK